VLSDYPGCAIISASAAEATKKRSAKTLAKIDALLNGRRNGVPTAPAPEAPLSAMVSATIVMPEQPSSSWRRSLTTGSGEREIERATAEKVCRLIVEDVFGRQRAQQTPITFDASASILLRDLHQALDDLCGSEGWKALVKRGEA
jgi:hypothetical protein